MSSVTTAETTGSEIREIRRRGNDRLRRVSDPCRRHLLLLGFRFRRLSVNLATSMFASLLVFFHRGSGRSPGARGIDGIHESRSIDAILVRGAARVHGLVRRRPRLGPGSMLVPRHPEHSPGVGKREKPRVARPLRKSRSGRSGRHPSRPQAVHWRDVLGPFCRADDSRSRAGSSGRRLGDPRTDDGDDVDRSARCSTRRGDRPPDAPSLLDFPPTSPPAIPSHLLTP